MGPDPTYLWRPPRAPELVGLVSSLEYVRNPPPGAWERMVPGGDVSLVLTLDVEGFGYREGSPGDQQEHWTEGSCLVGPASRAQVVSTVPQAGMVAVNFLPGGAAPFLRGPVAAAAESYVPFAELWGGDAAALSDAVRDAPDPQACWDRLEQQLVRRLLRPPVRDLAVVRAAAALDQGARVADVVAEFGTTAKPFVRRFRAVMGLPPKRYARVRRLQRVLRGLPDQGPVDWAAAAHRHGFADQSHLIHDFVAITGVRPSDYAPRAPGEVNHLPC